MTDDDKTQQRVAAAPTRKSPSGEKLPVIAGFEVKSVQGEGGMAKVYLAIDPALDRLVAIKMVSADLSADSEFQLRFQNEAKTVAQFRHPNIVSVYASGKAPEGQYIVMEFVDGGNLSDRLEFGALEEIEAVSVAQKMASALGYSHQRDIIHRDFKPGNILFTKDRTPILSDFGVAKSASPEKTPMTKVGVVIGSVQYMAPEQARGEKLTGQIDIYSFGLVLFEMLTRLLPERALVDSDAENQVRKHLKGHRRDIVDLICRCLQMDPAERPTADECASSLDNILRSMQPHSLPFGPWRINGTIVGIGITSLIVAAAIALAFLGKPPFSPDNPVRSIFSSGTATTSNVVIHNFDVEPSTAKLYLDGTEIEGTANLTTGSHNIVAVAANYFGQIVNVDVDENSGVTEIRLDPLTLPAQDELSRFISAMEAPQVMDGTLRNVFNPTLRQALQIKVLADSAALGELENLERRLDTLASYDDYSSVVTLYLAAEAEYLQRDSAGLLPGLQTAMNSGYAFATFWYAIRLRNSLDLERVQPDDPNYLRYCDTMRLAYTQGLADITEAYLCVADN